MVIDLLPPHHDNNNKRTMSHLWTSFTGSLGNLNFNGFAHGEIYIHDFWTIKPKMYSTTVAVEQDIYDQLMYELHGRYDAPEDKGHHGLIFRDTMTLPDGNTGLATITCYSSTCTLSVQGSCHIAFGLTLSSLKSVLS